jgi:hypothetical protein
MDGRVNWWNVMECCEVFFSAGVLSKPGLNQSAPQVNLPTTINYRVELFALWQKHLLWDGVNNDKRNP